MKRKNKFLLILGILFMFTIVGCTSRNSEAIDALSICLAEKNVKEYGAFWCPNCAKQQKMFGGSFELLKEKNVYIECDPRCDVELKDLPKACRGILGQSGLCIEKKIEKYPTWEFSDGTRIVGVQDLTLLAEKAGCEYEEDS